MINLEQAWEKCVTKEWCLSAECLTSRKAQNALNEYLRNNTELHTEIENCLGKVYGIDTGAEAEADLDQENDSDIPISAIM